MKQIKIFGKSIPILAILAILMIGTASAALFAHYATLDGDIEVTSNVWVNDLAIGDEGDLVFESPAPFEIHNEGNVPVLVDLVTTLELNGTLVTDETGLYVDYSIIPGSTNVVEEGLAIVPPGGVIATVDFTTHEFAVPGTYTTIVEVNPNVGAVDYHLYMEEVTLTHKDGNPDWNPIGDNSSLVYVAMGNDFYYELNVTGLDATTGYSIIYYADPWAGNNGIVIDSFVTDLNGEVITSGSANLNMNLPNSLDDNYGDGAKVWVVLSADLTNGDSMPMIAFNAGEYLYEYSEIQDDDFTDLVQYTDTNIV